MRLLLLTKHDRCHPAAQIGNSALYRYLDCFQRSGG
jgi:hypothetical protein